MSGRDPARAETTYQRAFVTRQLRRQLAAAKSSVPSAYEQFLIGGKERDSALPNLGQEQAPERPPVA
jgi:hypothetical protein